MKRQDVTNLEIALLVRASTPLANLPGRYHDEKWFTRRIEILQLRYADGLTFQAIADMHGVTKEAIRAVVLTGLRWLRHPNRRQVWRMLIIERPALGTSSLANHAYGPHWLHEINAVVAQSADAQR